MNTVTGKQIRAARALLGWSLAELAKQASICPTTALRIEHRGNALPRSLQSVLAAMDRGGVTFTAGGVEMKGNGNGR
jgi:transcriptional regulator with XRE-family HTH domain